MTEREPLTGQTEGDAQDERPQAEEQEQPQAEPTAPETLPDIAVGDMETDLPEPKADSTEAAESQEMEIPWGDVTLPEPGTPVAEEQPEEAQAPTEEPQAPAPAAHTYKHAWYVVHCYSGYENKVKKGLEQRINSMGMQDRIYRVVVPIEKEVEIKEGQRRNIERRVFPGYILVEMMELQQGEPSSDEAWYVVRNTPGVTGFVSSGDKPVPLREEEVNKILKRMETAEPKVHVTFRTGQTVHIIDGPFADFRGTVDAVDMTKGKVRVLVSFFGRETPVELDLLQVEKV